jgi:hypothetical protein
MPPPLNSSRNSPVPRFLPTPPTSSNFLLVLAALVVAPRLWPPPALLLSTTPAPSLPCHPWHC